MKSRLLFWTAAAAVFFAASLVLRIEWQKSRTVNLRLPAVSMMVQGLKPLHSASPSGAWAYVRATATFTKKITESIAGMINQINSSGVTMLNSWSGSVPNPAGGTMKVSYNGQANVTVPNGALGSATYKSSMYVWNSGGNKMLEMFFDASGAVLVRFMPSRIDATYISTGLVECQVSGTSGSRIMVCTWGGGPFNSGLNPAWDRARIKVQEVSSELHISALSSSVSGITCGAHPDWFTLAYIAKSASPYYTVAKFGYNDAGIGETICGGSNTLNYGLFNADTNASATDSSQYFVSQGTAAGAIPAGYPAAADVDTLFATITNSGTGEVTRDKLSALTGTPLAFYDSSAPSF